MKGQAAPCGQQALPVFEIRQPKPGINHYLMVASRYSRQQLGLGDTQLALLQCRLEMSRNMTDQGDVTDRQHQGQQGNPHGGGLAHIPILNQFMISGVIDQ